MGFSSSKLEDDKALLLCRERKRFVRQALDGRFLLAAAHVSYIESLKNTGIALKRFVEIKPPSESSLYTSTSANSQPVADIDRPLSQISCSSPILSHHADFSEALSPSPPPPPPSSGWFHVRYVRAGGTSLTTVKERPPVSLMATVTSSPRTPDPCKSQFPLDAQESDPPPAPETPPWDYFGLFRPTSIHFSSEDTRQGLTSAMDSGYHIKRFREEEGMPDLEEDGEKSSITEGGDQSSDSEDDFDDPSNVPLVRTYQRQVEVSYSPVTPPYDLPQDDTNEKQKQLIRDGSLHEDSIGDADHRKAHDMIPLECAPLVAHPSGAVTVESVGEPGLCHELRAKDFFSAIKEIEDLFARISESGQEVPRMLEANKLYFQATFDEPKAPILRPTKFLSACFACIEDPEVAPHDTPASGMKYLTWHRSASSQSSSSRNPLGSTSKDEILDNSSNIFSSFCMNSGSHASTLDRLYAWEKKLYDEVKVSGIIRREYDMKCKQLRHQDSKADKPLKVDKTRAAVKDLHSRIRVAIQRIDSVSRSIEDLRDKELQPQLEELIDGLSLMWEMMLENHRRQLSIISIAYGSENSNISLESESHQQAALYLETELRSLCSNFIKWIRAQKSYLQAINSWILKCVFLVRRKSSSRRNMEFSPRRTLAPPIYVTCQDWLQKLEELPTGDVVEGIRGLLLVTAQHLPRKNKLNQKKSPSVFSWKADGTGETGSDMRRDEGSMDSSLSFESVKPSLVVFFEQFSNFADLSMKKYRELQVSVKEFKHAYEIGGMRMPM